MDRTPPVPQPTVRPLCVLVLLPVLLSCRSEPRAEILWDTYGVPHIYAAGPQELLFAQGWAQMESHADLILRLYGRARGRAAEYWGEEELASDIWVRLNSVPQRASAWWRLQGAEFGTLLTEFVRGMNAYATRNPGAVSDDAAVVLPITPEDVLAHSLRTIHFTFMAGAGIVPAPFREGLMARRLSRVGDPGSAYGADRAGSREDSNVGGRGEKASTLGTRGHSAEPSAGSNAWAIAPARSASGNALLLGNSHFPWGGLYTWHEANLVTPEINAYGAGLVGMPLLNIAFNDHLGWTHTVNTYDGVDLYELTLEGDGYLFDGSTRAFEVRLDTLLVKLESGEMVEHALTVHSSVHGPVVGETEDRALALRVAGLDAPHMGAQLWDMIRARNLEDFEAAMSRLQIPMMTTMYADQDGHILHIFNGRVPVRRSGDATFWRGVVPGDISETLWTDCHSYADLPRVLDPESGWLQNTNDPPWTTTLPFPMNPADYPPYMAPPPSMSFRTQQSARLLLEDASITFEELDAYKHSTRMELADRLLEELIAAARTLGGDEAREAARVLEAWDRHADAESRGATLFLSWVDEIYRRTGGNPFAHPWDPSNPLGTPSGFENPAVAADALETAARGLRAQTGGLDVPFGTVYRVRRDEEDLPGNGFSGPVGTFRAGWYAPGPDGRFQLMGGDTFVLLVEFGTPIRARTALVYGNASQPGSPHRTDQLALFSEKRLRPVWRTREEVEANLERQTVLEPLPGSGDF